MQLPGYKSSGARLYRNEKKKFSIHKQLLRFDASHFHPYLYVVSYCSVYSYSSRLRLSWRHYRQGYPSRLLLQATIFPPSTNGSPRMEVSNPSSSFPSLRQMESTMHGMITMRFTIHIP